MFLPSVFLSFLFGAFARGALALVNLTGPIVDLGYAAYLGNATTPTGVEDGPVVFFGGIPFAEPPLGNLRWRAPRMLDESVLPSESVSVSDARNFASPCIQQPAKAGVGAEDCLYLNVWMPANATNTSSLPVAFYIYGGGFFAGTTQGFPMYDWVAQNPGIVAVSAAYRLNALGFLAGPGIVADGDYNVGLLDQRAAMEWVQRHISAFGGDPDEVTIIGESAGAASVVMHITAYGGNQTAPFKRAVTQSIGYGPSQTAVGDETDTFFANFTASVGCPADLSPTDAMACLRNVTVDDLILGINNQTTDTWNPVYGDAFLPDLPSQLLRDGRFTPVEYMGGHCSGDGHTFSYGSPTTMLSEADIVAKIFENRWVGVSNETIREVFEFYPEVNATDSPLSSYYDLGSEIGGDIVFSCMDEFIAEYMLDAGVDNVFTFLWNAPNPVLYANAPYRWAAHTSDLFFLFSGTTLSTALNTDSQAWPPYSTDDRRRMVFTRGNDTETASSVEPWSNYKTSRCKWWFQQNITAQTTV
ncbi:alpha/beta-hydrolase [Peniophora sp. CONT]|nr:alpha/beta-hydrolase [Peniophora sp. CONT]